MKNKLNDEYSLAFFPGTLHTIATILTIHFYLLGLKIQLCFVSRLRIENAYAGAPHVRLMSTQEAEEDYTSPFACRVGMPEKPATKAGRPRKSGN